MCGENSRYGEVVLVHLLRQTAMVNPGYLTSKNDNLNN